MLFPKNCAGLEYVVVIQMLLVIMSSSSLHVMFASDIEQYLLATDGSTFFKRYVCCFSISNQFAQFKKWSKIGF